jgi:heme A synthase
MMIRPYQITIAGLMAFILYVGLILATLRHEDQYRATRTLNPALLALWAATVYATLGKESVRDQVRLSMRLALSGYFGAAMHPSVSAADGRSRRDTGVAEPQAPEGMP